MTVRIGINPLTWTNDDMPELGAETPLEVCLTEARRAGYVGIELGNKFPRQADTLAPILEAHGLSLVSGWYSARLLERSGAAEIEALGAHRDLLSALGCEVMVISETSGCVHRERGVSLATRPVLDDARWKLLAARLTEVGEHLAARGLRLAYHHHMGTVVQSEEEIDRLMGSVGESVGLLLDTGHLTFAGGDPVAVAKRHAARIVHVHLKDIRGALLTQARAEDLSFLDAVLAGVFTVPGDGIVDTSGVLASLGRVSYDGWLVVEAEQDPAKAHPFTYAKTGYENVSRLAREAGLLA